MSEKNNIISLESILKTLKQWESESKNFRNDGWVQSGYRSNIEKVFSECHKIITKSKRDDSKMI